MTYRHVMIGTDFSESAQAALRFGAALARHFGARVTLAHVFDPTPQIGSLRLPTAVDLASHAAAVRDDLQAVAATELAGLESVECVTRSAPSAGHALVELARERAADLCVVGTHGRSGIARMLAGSVAEKVVRHAACDVIAVPMQSPSWPPGRILVGTDFSAASTLALDAAAALGRATGAEVRVAHVIDDSGGRSKGELKEAHQPSLDVARERIGGTAGAVFLSGTSAARELCAHAKKREFGLLVVGTHGRSAFAQLFIGSQAERSVRHAPCAVLVVRSAPVDAA